ncbi:uncharacterized protein LOC133206398 [Saccostrea echinata]|uniref:uncharacterized protein LOC133206398 n=1 Tax=Saccostrea echinata TaxID=191078 RepID=UPI002A81093A|nr:uncharacterized protein LOC133206398 [Saccostrea echinata]
MSVCQCENLTYLLGFDVLQQSLPFETEDRFVKYVNFDFEPKYRTKRFLIFAGTLLPIGKDDGCNRDVIVKVRRERPAADDYWGFYFARSGISRNVLARFDRVVDEELELDIEFVDEYEAKFSGYTQWNEFMMQFKDYNHRTLTSGEHIVVEPYLHGQFQNFDKYSDAIMDSLAHFSYHTSRGQYLLHGLKGVKLDGSYRLTVPLIHSINKDFGPRDMAMEGITRFFRNHNCTDICHGWSKPELTDINMNTKDIGVLHKTDRNQRCHRNDTRDVHIEKIIADEGIYNSISEPENEENDQREADDNTATSKAPKEEQYHYAKVNKKAKDKGFEEVDLSENMEITSEDASVYGGSQDTGYSSIRELKDFQFEKDHHGDDITSDDPYLNDPDETAVIGLGNINMYNNEKYNSGFVDIHQYPQAFYREYENEKVTTTAIIHSENREDSLGEKVRDSKKSDDVYDTIDSVSQVRRDINRLSVTEHSQVQNTVV